MFKLNNQPTRIDQDLVIGEGDDAITIPAASLQDQATREQYGIVEVADPVRQDDRFYWVASDGTATPKDLGTLKTQMIGQVKQTANSLLSASDWQVWRKFERGIEIDAATAAYRSAVLDSADANEASIVAAADVEALAALQIQWPEVQP